MFKKRSVNSGKQGQVNHVIIVDRSGSMSWAIKQVMRDVRKMLPSLAMGDTLSVGWFSSENGTFGWLVQAHLVTPETPAFVGAILEKNASTVAMTCFSEVLQSAKSVLEMLPANDNYLTFLTDGHPVVSNTRKEEERTLAALKALKLDSAVFIGYGSYYNRAFMAQMAEVTGGTLVHASEVEEIGSVFMDVAGAATPMVEIPAESQVGFYFTDSGVYKARIQDQRAFVPSSAREVWFLSGDGEMNLDAAYGLAYLLMTEARADEAIELLGQVGDVALIDIVSQAFTNEEYGLAQRAIMTAALHPKARFSRGRNTNYLPDPNAYCLLDLLEDLNQEGVYFLPRSPEFKYNRVGAKRFTKEGYPKFIEDEDQRSPFNTLVWHGSQANVSLSATIKGYIDLGAEAELYGLPREFQCVQIRNYTIVKDGVLNVKELPVVIPDNVAMTISMGARLLDSSEEGQAAYVLDLTSLPIINKRIANESVKSIGSYLVAAEAELELEAAYKSYRHFMNLLNPNKVKDGIELTEPQQVFLKSKGVVNGIYSPPTESPDFEDVYVAKEVVIARAGFSSWPSVDKVVAALSGNGKLNAAGTVMAAYVRDAMQMDLAALTKKVDGIKKDLKAVREPMYKARFAVIVGNKWFSDLTERDGAKVSDWTISLKEKQVKF